MNYNYCVGNLVSTVETLTPQIECWDSLGSRVQSPLMSKPYKCCSMLREAFFSLFEWLWGCALSWSLATSNLKPIWNPREVSSRRPYPHEGFLCFSIFFFFYNYCRKVFPKLFEPWHTKINMKISRHPHRYLFTFF
jgi:hypothetical protein